MMDKILKVKSISIWIFIVPFIAINACLLLSTQFHWLIPSELHQYRLPNTFPYFDGEVSISRTARYFPAYLIFKPAMFLTAFLLIKYWLLNKEIIQNFEKNHKNLNKIIFFLEETLTTHHILLCLNRQILQSYNEEIYRV